MTRLVAALVCLLALWACHAPPPPPEPTRALTIAFTHDAQGEITACDCPAGAAGGLARRVGFLRDLRAKRPDRLLVIEAGDFLFPAAAAGDRAVAQSELTAAAYARAGYDAVLFGRADYALGLSPLRKFAHTTGATILGANVIDNATGKPAWAQSAVLRRGGVNVGLLGVVDDGSDLPGVLVQDAAEAAARWVAHLRQTADVVILVTNLTREKLTTVLARTGPVDFVIRGSRAKMITERVQMLGDVPTFSLFEGGRYAGTLELTVVAHGQPFTDLTERGVLDARLARYRQYLATIEGEAGGVSRVADHLADRPENWARYQRYGEQIAEWDEALDRLDESGNRFQYRLVELADAVPVDDQTAGAVEAFVARGGARKP